ncbi:ATP-binding protein [Variovorax sp. J22P168]|nr:ATP-binding protein [Variovorax sp. J22P168]
MRSRLLVSLAALNLVAIAATAWFSYVAYGRLVNGFMDDQMRLVAESHIASPQRLSALQAVSADDVLQRGAFVVQIWRGDGAALLASSSPAFAVPLQPGAGFVELRSDTGAGAGEGWRVYTAPRDPGGGADTPQVQVIQSDRFRHQRIVRRALFESLPILLLLPVTLLLLWFIVAGASRSLREVAREVAAQDEASPHGLPVARVPEELAPLVAAFNTLLGRLRDALSTQRRFMQDAAHELRTPMAAIGLQIDNLRAHVPSGDAADRFAQLEGGVRRAQHLIEQLLRLSRQDAPAAGSGSGGARGPVDISALLRDSVGQLMVLADQRRVDVGFEGRVSPWVNAPPAELRSVFDNLIDNAVRYASEGGVVDVRLHVVDGLAVVDVVDDGPGVPPDQLDRLFDRFYRVAGSPAGGSGLGLAIAQAAAQRHGMRIELANRSDRSGLVARVHLPRAN